MGKHSKRRRSVSPPESVAERDYHNKKKHKKELHRRDIHIKALEGLVRELQKKQNYSNNDVSCSAAASVAEICGPSPISRNTGLETSTTIRYVGHNQFVPEFNPQTSSVSIEHWLRTLESIGNMCGWDEKTLICNCISKLGGYAKSWYEHQDAYDIPWEDWKRRLIKAFPVTKNKLSQIRELVNKIKMSTEDPIKFYYDKLAIGMSCNMADDVITEAIIGTLGDKLLEVGAVSAGCSTTTSLLQYLTNVKTSSVLSLGKIETRLSVDGVERLSEFLVVPDTVQDFDVLIGQPFTEASDIVVIKTSSQLNIFDKESVFGLLDLCEELEKLKLYPDMEVTLHPGGLAKMFLDHDNRLSTTQNVWKMT